MFESTNLLQWSLISDVLSNYLGAFKNPNVYTIDQLNPTPWGGDTGVHMRPLRVTPMCSQN